MVLHEINSQWAIYVSWRLVQDRQVSLPRLNSEGNPIQRASKEASKYATKWCWLPPPHTILECRTCSLFCPADRARGANAGNQTSLSTSALLCSASFNHSIIHSLPGLPNVYGHVHHRSSKSPLQSHLLWCYLRLRRAFDCFPKLCRTALLLIFLTNNHCSLPIHIRSISYRW